MDWYQKESGEVVEELNSSVTGLSAEEAQNRFKKYGPNELEEKKEENSTNDIHGAGNRQNGGGGLRSEHDSLFKIGVFSNKPLLGACC